MAADAARMGSQRGRRAGSLLDLDAEPVSPPARRPARPGAQAASADALGGRAQGLPDLPPRAAVGGLQLRPPAAGARPAGQAAPRQLPGSPAVGDPAADASELVRVAGDPPLGRLLTRARRRVNRPAVASGLRGIHHRLERVPSSSTSLFARLQSVAGLPLWRPINSAVGGRSGGADARRARAGNRPAQRPTPDPLPVILRAWLWGYELRSRRARFRVRTSRSSLTGSCRGSISTSASWPWPRTRSCPSWSASDSLRSSARTSTTFSRSALPA